MAQALRIRRASDSGVCDDCSDEFVRSDIKSRIEYVDSFRNDSNSSEMGYFRGIALFDRNVGAVGDVHIQRRQRRGDVKRNVMLPGKNGMRGRGGILVALGIAIPVLYVVLSGGP